MNRQGGAIAPLLETIGAIGPGLAERSVEIEASRRLPDDIAQDLRNLGIAGLPAPKAYGGGECSAEDMMRVIEELSYFDSSVGWCAMIYLTSGAMAGLFPPDWAKVIYGGGTMPLIGGAIAPSGRGRPVEGGVEVSGHWAWGSGTYHCDWICGGTLVGDGGEPDSLKADSVRLMVFEREQVKLHDNWDPSGLRGTGSVDFEVTDAFVPEGRWIALGAITPTIDAPLYRFPFFCLLASCICAASLGIARRAIDEFVALTRGKVALGQKETAGGDPVTNAELARSEAYLAASRAYIYEEVARTWSKVAAGNEATLEDRRKIRLAAAHAAERSAAAVDALYTRGGGSSIHWDNPLQRCFRDVHVVTQHRMTSPVNYELAGAFKLDDSDAAAMF